MSGTTGDIPDRIHRDRGQFARASPHANMVCAAAACAGVTVLAVSLIPLTSRTMLWWAAVWITGIAAVLLGVSTRRHAQAMSNDPNEGDGLAAQYGNLPRHLMQGGSIHPSLKRVIDVAETQFPGKLALKVESVEIVDGKLRAWGFQAVETAYLSKATTFSQITDAFGRSVPGPDGKKGRWRFALDTNTDSFTATQYDGIKKLVFPPHWHVVQSAEEARKKFPGWECELGVKEGNQPVRVSHQTFSHWLLAGKTGGGKTKAAYNIIEQHRAAGWMLLIGDGKGMDYRSYRGIPGVVGYGSGATSNRPMAYIAVIELAYRILLDRQSKPDADLSSNTPVLLVLDEIKAKILEWKSSLSNDEFRAVINKVDLILSQGRQLRVFVLLLSQDMRDKSIPGSWGTNVSLTIVVGPPDHITLDKAFHESIHFDVEQIVATMDESAKGRCIVGGVDPDKGGKIAVEYQGYLSYAPGENVDDEELPRDVKVYWPPFRQAVSDRVPFMYSRQWFQWENHPIAEQEKAATSPYIAADVSHFDSFTVQEIEAMNRVSLNRRGPDNTLGRSRKYMQYDPLDPQHYKARIIASASNHIDDEI